MPFDFVSSVLLCSLHCNTFVCLGADNWWFSVFSIFSLSAVWGTYTNMRYSLFISFLPFEQNECSSQVQRWFRMDRFTGLFIWCFYSPAFVVSSPGRCKRMTRWRSSRELRKWVRSAGFFHVARSGCCILSCGIVYLSWTRFWTCSLSKPLASVWPSFVLRYWANKWHGMVIL